MSGKNETKIARKGVVIAFGIICIVLVVGLVTTIAVYTSAISSLNSQFTNLQKQLTTLQKQVNDLQNTTDFILEFGNVPVLSPSINFSPPVSMYRALTIALESDGWNASSLSNMEVEVSLDYWSSSNFVLYSVTQPPKDYSSVKVNDTTYRYIWDIVVQSTGELRFIAPPHYWVDAATGEIVPQPPLL